MLTNRQTVKQTYVKRKIKVNVKKKIVWIVRQRKTDGGARSNGNEGVIPYLQCNRSGASPLGTG